jgi:hypothetical protein
LRRPGGNLAVAERRLMDEVDEVTNEKRESDEEMQLETKEES